MELAKQILKFKFPLKTIFTGRLTKHETIKAQLHYLAFKYDLFPLPEAYVYDNTKHRIDMLWVNREKESVYAFEIDGNISSKSVRKLLDSTASELFIISTSYRTRRFEESLRKAKVTLHFYQSEKDKREITIISLGLQKIVPLAI